MDHIGAWMVSAFLAAAVVVALYGWYRQAGGCTNSIAKSQLRFEQLLKAFPEHCFVIDHSCRILAFNQSPQVSPLQLSLQPQIGKQLQDYFPAGFINVFKQACDQALSSNTTITARLDEGVKGQLSLKFWMTLLDNKASGAEFLLVLRNTDELRAAEQLKNDFLSNVSHEMRTPLTSITGALGLIAGGELDGLPENVVSMVSIAYKNSQRLSRLVNDLLEIENISSGKLTLSVRPYLLASLVEQALEANRLYAENHCVELMLMPHVIGGEIAVDSERFLQVMDKLLSNAIKFSPKNSRVELYINQLENQLLRISVVDQGPGIALDVRESVFQRFAHIDSALQSESKDSGSGLGLAIAKELVELMGGRIGFECAKGTGAIFYIDLPKVSHFSTLSPIGSSDDFRGKRILVIEDEAEVARLISLMLQQEGYRVDIAMSGTAALRALSEFHYDAVTVDLLLPDFSGLEVIRRIRTNPALAHVSIIVVSAKLEAGQLMFSGDSSTIEWLAKPVGRDQLRDAIDRRLHDTHIQRMLYVEDDVDLQYVISAMVGKNYTVVPAATLAQARAALAKQSFEVILLDIGLPDGSGWDLLPEIRERLPAARVVMLSGEDLSSADVKKAEAVLLKSKMTERQLLNALEATPKAPKS